MRDRADLQILRTVLKQGAYVEAARGVALDVPHRALEPQRARLLLRRSLLAANGLQPELHHLGRRRVFQIEKLVYLGDRCLVAAERGRLAPLRGASIEIVRDGFRRRRQCDPHITPTPEVEALEVGFERADAVGRGRRLVGGDQRFVDDDRHAGAHLHHRPRQIVGRRYRRRHAGLPR